MLLDQPNEESDDVSRPLVQSSSCLAEMTGTPRAWAAATIASDSVDAATSVWMLATKAP